MAGIADLSLDADPYLSRDEDHAAARALAAASHLAFPDVLASYYRHNALVPAHQAAHIIAATLAAPERSRAFLEQAESLAGMRVGAGMAVLDAGAGTGPLSVELAGRGADTWAADIGLRWLVLAQARATSAGVAISCVGAAVSKLPFTEQAFDIVVAESLLEWVPDPGAALSDLRRVLRPGGWLFLSTPNRWWPGPDPHLGLPLLSMAPRALVHVAARARGVLPPRRTLLGRRGLTTLLRSSGFEQVRLEAPVLPPRVARSPSPVLRAAAGGYDWARRAPGVGSLVAWGTPLHVAVARRA